MRFTDAEIKLPPTQIHKTLSCSEIRHCVAVWAVATTANHWRHETSEAITCWRSFVSQIKGAPHTNSAVKIYKILKLRATLKCVNFPPVQAVTNLTFTWQLIGTKFFRISVHSDWGTEIVLSQSFQENVQTVLPVGAWYLLNFFYINFATHQPITRHYTVCTVGSVVR